MSVTISPNMQLPIPGVGLENGPDYADDINQCLSQLDQHDHSSGSGVQITPSGLSINSDLPFLNNNATGVRSLRFQPQSAALSAGSDIGCLYETGVDLYFRDGNGNNVRITQSGAVAGTPGSIANLVSPASATYVSANSTFVWKSAALTPANLDAASMILRNLSASSKGMTLAPPAAMAVDVTVTLPTLPGTTNILSMDSSGAMSAAINVDNSTLQLSANTLAIKDSGVVTAKIADSAVTQVKLGTLGQQVSSSCGVYTVPSSSFTDVTNLSVTITTYGRPVRVFLQGAGGGAIGDMSATISGAAVFRLLRGATEIGRISFGAIVVPPPGIDVTDVVAAGTYTYKVQAAVTSGSAAMSNLVLVACPQ